MSVLEFQESTHTYTLDGVRVPSVTQILKPMYSFYGVPDEVLQAKAELGTNVHRACELLDNDDLDEDSEEGLAALEPIAGYLAGYKKFKADKKPVVIANEQRLYHPLHKYAGTIDRRLAFLILTAEQRKARGLSGHFGDRSLQGLYLGCQVDGASGVFKHLFTDDHSILTSPHALKIVPDVYPLRLQNPRTRKDQFRALMTLICKCLTRKVE